MSSKTTIEEFDKDGKLVKRTVITKDDDLQIPNGYPARPFEPWVRPKPYWEPGPWSDRDRIWS